MAFTCPLLTMGEAKEWRVDVTSGLVHRRKAERTRKERMGGAVTGGGDGGEEGVAVEAAVHERAVDLCAAGECEGLLVDLAAANDKALGHVVPRGRKVEGSGELKEGEGEGEGEREGEGDERETEDEGEGLTVWGGARTG